MPMPWEISSSRYVGDFVILISNKMHNLLKKCLRCLCLGYSNCANFAIVLMLSQQAIAIQTGGFLILFRVAALRPSFYRETALITWPE